MNLNTVISNMQQVHREKFHKLIRLTFNKYPKSKKRIPRSKISEHHVKEMVASGLCEKVTEKCRVTSNIFLVPEIEKHRFRVITWPIELNSNITEIYKEMGTFSLNDITETFVIVQDSTHGAVIDLKCSFYQVGLSTAQGDAFIFKANDQRYRMKKLPMGLSTSAEIMQLICTQLTEKCNQVHIVVHIDNILIAGSKDKVNEAVSTILETAKSQDITVGECLSGSQVEAFGFRFDFQSQEVTISAKKLIKIKALRDVQWQSLTIREFLAHYGKIFYYARAMWSHSTSTNCLSDHFNSIQLLRQTARKITETDYLTLDTELHLTNTDISSIKKMLESLLRSPAVPLTSLKRKFLTVTSDASNTGAGWIVRDENNNILREMSTDSTDDLRHINEKELHSLGLAIKACSQMIKEPHQISWYSDNITAITVLEKKSSASRTLNDVLRFVQHMSQIYNLPVTRSKWIPTAQNEADELSRIGIVTDVWKTLC